MNKKTYTFEINLSYSDSYSKNILKSYLEDTVESAWEYVLDDTKDFYKFQPFISINIKLMDLFEVKNENNKT